MALDFGELLQELRSSRRGSCPMEFRSAAMLLSSGAEIRHQLNREFQPMLHTSECRRALHAVVGSTLALSMGALGLASANAATITPDNVSPAAHVFDCLGALFSDPAAHQQYCGSGSGGTTPPSTLAPTFSSPAVTCQPVGNLPSPQFVIFKTASLDDSVIDSDLARHLTGTHVSSLPDCPPPCTASLDRPTFPTFDIASLDRAFSPAGLGEHLTGLRVAFCCYSSLSRPLFSTFGVATLEDHVAIPASTVGRSPLAGVC